MALKSSLYVLGALYVTCCTVTPAIAQVRAPGSQVGTNQPSNEDDDRPDSATQPALVDTGPFEPVQISPQNGSGDRDSRNEDGADRRDETTVDTSARIRPPAEPGEFERFVQDATGRRIRRFGEDLVVPALRDFMAPASVTVPPDYALNPGDVVSVGLTGSIEGSADFVINNSGEIFIPRIGSVKLAGVRFRDLRDRIAAVVGTQYRGFEVTVAVNQLHGIRVYVTGFANNPGAYSVSGLSTLVNGVLAAGGPSSGGSFRSVKLYRNGREIADFDLYDLVRGGNRRGDVVLQNEDVLFIAPTGNQVAVIGSVNEEAIYEIKPGENLEQVLALAGGVNDLADKERLILYRLAERETVGSRQIPRSLARTELAAAGDIVQILSAGSLVQPLEKQSVIVRLEGEVNRPGNYFVQPGTPLSQVLAQAGGLTSRAYVYGASLQRESVKAQQRESFREAISQLETTLASAPLTGDRTIDPAERASQLQAARAILQRMREAEPDGRLVLSLPYTATTLPEDLILENNDRIIVPPRVDTVGVFGAVYRPASFLLQPDGRMSVREYVDRAGGTQRAADRSNMFVLRASGEVLTSKRGAWSAKAQPGDVVFVPTKTESSSLLAKIRDISTILFNFGLSAAAIAAIN